MALVSIDILGIGTSIELTSQRGERVVASGVPTPSSGTPTTSSSADNAADVPVAIAATTIASVGPVTLTATQFVDLSAMMTWTNTSEGLATGSTVTIQVFDGITALRQPMTNSSSAGEGFADLSWLASLTGFSAGAHTFNLVATSTSDVGNGKVAAHQGVLNVRVFGT